MSPVSSSVPNAATNPTQITLTQEDFERLSALIERYNGGRLAPLAEALEDEVVRARVVSKDEIAKDIVTMNSRSVFRFLDTGDEREVTLVYPEQADVDTHRISVLAPIGTALLGLSVGQTIRWPTPEGERTLELIAVRYQPEASGDLHL